MLPARPLGRRGGRSRTSWPSGWRRNRRLRWPRSWPRAPGPTITGSRPTKRRHSGCRSARRCRRRCTSSWASSPSRRAPGRPSSTCRRPTGAARGAAPLIAEGAPMEAMTLAGVMDDLTRRGYTEQFMVADGGLRAVGSGKRFPADQTMISEYHRFEGVSDPDDMSIIYAIETRSGIRGTLVDAFGVYADPQVGEFMADVALRNAGPSSNALQTADESQRRRDG